MEVEICVFKKRRGEGIFGYIVVVGFVCGSVVDDLLLVNILIHAYTS